MKWLILAVLFVGCGTAEPVGLVTFDGETCEYTGPEPFHIVEFRNESDVEAFLAAWPMTTASSGGMEFSPASRTLSDGESIDLGRFLGNCQVGDKLYPILLSAP